MWIVFRTAVSCSCCVCFRYRDIPKHTSVPRLNWWIDICFAFLWLTPDQVSKEILSAYEWSHHLQNHRESSRLCCAPFALRFLPSPKGLAQKLFLSGQRDSNSFSFCRLLRPWSPTCQGKGDKIDKDIWTAGKHVVTAHPWRWPGTAPTFNSITTNPSSAATSKQHTSTGNLQLTTPTTTTFHCQPTSTCTTPTATSTTACIYRCLRGTGTMRRTPVLSCTVSASSWSAAALWRFSWRGGDVVQEALPLNRPCVLDVTSTEEFGRPYICDI